MHSSKYWRGRAEEARAQLEQMKNGDAIEAMRLVIENYDKLAKIAETQERADGPSESRFRS